MPKIFISYRRDDTKDQVIHIRNRLQGVFGEDNVFLDIDVHSGTKWKDNLRNQLQESDIVLVIIGDKWLTITGHDGNPRLFADGDWVREEVEEAIEQNKIIIPILMSGASEPSTEDLPPSIQELTDYQFQPLRVGRDYNRDMGDLISAIQKHLPTMIIADAFHKSSNLSKRNYPELIEENRRLDAATPSYCQVGKPTEVRVMICIPDSEGLRALLPDYTEAGDLITKSDVREGSLAVEFPTNQDTGKPESISVSVELQASDFNIADPVQKIRLSPTIDSGSLVFNLTPKLSSKTSRIHVLVKSHLRDGTVITLGSATLITEIKTRSTTLSQIVWMLVSIPLIKSEPKSVTKSRVAQSQESEKRYSIGFDGQIGNLPCGASFVYSTVSIFLVIIAGGFFFINNQTQNANATASTQAVINTSEAQTEVAAAAQAEAETETQIAERNASATAAERERPTETATRRVSSTPSPTPRFAGLQALRELSVRTGPSSAYRELRSISAGEQLEIVGQNGRWYQVLLPTGTTGWVLNSPLFVDSFGPLDNIPVVEVATITPTATNTPDRRATAIKTMTETSKPDTQIGTITITGVTVHPSDGTGCPVTINFIVSGGTVKGIFWVKNSSVTDPYDENGEQTFPVGTYSYDTDNGYGVGFGSPNLTETHEVWFSGSVNSNHYTASCQ